MDENDDLLKRRLTEAATLSHKSILFQAPYLLKQSSNVNLVQALNWSDILLPKSVVKSNPLVNSHNSRLGCQSIVDYLDVIEKMETGSIAENIKNITIRCQ